MIPWLPVSYRTLAIVGIALCVFAAGWSANGWRLNAKHATELRKMLEAGAEATKRRDLAMQSLREQSLEDADRIARLSRGTRVRCYADRPDVPAAGADADPAGDHREAGKAAVDATDVLRQCLRTFGEVNRTLSGVSP